MKLTKSTFLLCIIAFATIQSKQVESTDFGNGHVIRDVDSKSTVHSILNNLEKGKRMVAIPSDPNIVIVLGNTGAGKSTLVQLIAGNNSNLISQSTSDDPDLPTDEFTIKDTGNKIGNSTILSHTELPELVLDNETRTAIYDCPGFSDTRTPEHEISGTFYIKYILDNAKAIKFIFVVNYNSVKINSDKIDFMSLATHATNMIKNITQFKDGIAIVATKVTDDKENKVIINNIVKFLKTIKTEINYVDKKKMDDSKKANIIQFVDALLTKNDTNGPNGTPYPRIGFFRNPKKEGPLSSIQEVQDNKKLLKSLIHENINYIKSHKEDFGYTISDMSQNYIIKLVDEVNNNVSSSVNDVAMSVQGYYDDLVIDMLNKIKSFVNSSTYIDCDSSEAQSFLMKLNTGYDVILTWTKEIDDITNLLELSNKIKNILTNLNINISQDRISNILTQGEYLEFLHMVGRTNENYLSSKASWAYEWQNCSSHLRKLKDNIQEIVSNTIQSITDEIKQNIARSGEETETFFSSKENTNNDLKSLYEEMYRGHSILKKTRDVANSLSSIYNCIKKIKDDVNNLNITNTNISPRDSLSNTLKYGRYVDFLQILNRENKTFKFAEELNKVIEYLNSSKEWYKFLIRLYDYLSEYEIQTNTTICNELSNNVIQGENLEEFLRKCCPKCEFRDIKNISYNTSIPKSLALKKVLNTTLKSGIVSNCENQPLGTRLYKKLVITGQYVKLKDVVEINNCTNVKFIVIFALKKVFVDVDLDKTGEEIQLFIITPIWDIQGDRKILLRGKSPHSQLKRADDGDYPSGNGEDGETGEPGGPGGHFTGIGANFFIYNSLTIDISGGNGSNGQNGGNGANGKDARDLQISDIGSNYDKTINDLKENVRFNHKNHGSCVYSKFKFEEYWDCTEKYYAFCGYTYRYNTKRVNGLFGHMGYYIKFYSPKDNTTINVECVGGNGGRGGKGGEYGYPGNVTIISLQDNIKIKILDNGVSGSNGEYGKKGVGGKCSSELLVYFRDIDPTNIFDHLSISHGSRMCNCQDGHEYENDYNKKNMKYKERQPTLLQASFIINDYKKYLREHLNSDVQKSYLEEFLNQIENSNEVKRF